MTEGAWSCAIGSSHEGQGASQERKRQGGGMGARAFSSRGSSAVTCKRVVMGWCFNTPSGWPQGSLAPLHTGTGVQALSDFPGQCELWT